MSKNMSFHRDFKILFDGGKSIDCVSFLNDILHFKEALESSKKPKNIAICLEDYYEFLIGFFGACCYIGALKKTQKNDIKIILLSSKKCNKNMFLLDENAFKNIMRKDSKKDNNINAKGEWLDTPIGLDSAFFIQTSGSSGKSKLIAKSIGQMIDEAVLLKHTLQEHYALTTTPTFLASVVAYHLYGLTFRVFLPMVWGGSVINELLNLPENIAKYLSKNLIEPILLSSPTLLQTLSQHSDKSALNHIKTLISAGAKLEKHIRDNVGVGERLFEVYGSSETGVIAYNKGGGFYAFKGVRLELREDFRLSIQSQWSNEGEGGGAFISNDCARLESSGKLTLLGRVDRIIKIHDKRVSLEMIEEKLKTHQFIEDCFIGLGKHTQRLDSLIVLNQKGGLFFRKCGKSGLNNELGAFLKEDFGNLVRYFVLCDKLPKNEQGKITKEAFINALNRQITPDFTIIKNTSNALEARTFISPACFYFSGHFRDFPLVPGFVEVGFVYELAEKMGIELGQLLHIESVKFNTFLRPLDTLKISLFIKETKLYFNLYANDKTCASGRIKLANKE